MVRKDASEQAPDKGKKGRKKLSRPLDEDDDIAIRALKKARGIRGTALAALKPSYSLKVGTGRPNPHPDEESFRSTHRRRLRLLLSMLLRQRDWAGACGCLSVLLRASANETSIPRIRRKYWAVLELLQYAEGDSITTAKLLDVYDLRIKKIGPMKAQPVKERFAAQRELIVFCLQQGDLKDAEHAALGLMQERGFDSDSVSNLLVGLTYFCLWYSGLPKEMQLGDMSRPGNHVPSVVSEDGIQSVESINSFTPFEAHMSKLPLRCDSSTSVGNEKENMISATEPIRAVPVDTDVDDHVHKETTGYRFVKEDFDSISTERQGDEGTSSQILNEEIPSTSIFYTHGLPPWLLPLQLPHSTEDMEKFIYMHRNSLNEYYNTALTHLRAAVHMESPAFGAFHPLIQILLAGDKVEEALDEAEKLNHNSCTVLQLRLKATMMKHFNKNDNSKLIELTEDILKRDPTCKSSVAKLVDFHLSGQYSTEKLVEMIGSHLDVTFAPCITWEVFASCFLTLSRSRDEEDKFSTCSGGGDGDVQNSNSTTRIPAIFSGRISQHNWRLRCRWWRNRHYCRKMIETEIAEGDLRLMTYKAAVAAHLYGGECGYVAKVSEHLQIKKMEDLLSILRIHTHNCGGFFL